MLSQRRMKKKFLAEQEKERSERKRAAKLAAEASKSKGAAFSCL